LAQAGVLAPQLSLKGGLEFTTSKTELSATVQLSAFAHVVENKLTILGLDWSKETIEREGGPTGKLLEDKVSGGFDVPIPIALDDGTEVNVNCKATISATFKPNWPRILEILVEGLSSEALVAAASIAGAGLLIYMQYDDMARRGQLRARVTRAVRATFGAANFYGMVMVGEGVEGGKTDGLSARAASQAAQDLNERLAEWGLERGQYLTMIEVAGSRDLIFSQTSRAYADAALAAYREQVRKQVVEWHAEHWFQSLLSMGSVADDMAEVDDVIREYASTGGFATHWSVG
jgi:hypothetical protein